jgi:hypothetical protein
MANFWLKITTILSVLAQFFYPFFPVEKANFKIFFATKKGRTTNFSPLEK